MKTARVGVDFDNTIVCYDDLIGDLSFEKKLTPRRLSSKSEVRDYLRAAGREDDWTALQGEVYGPALARARAFPGALEFLGGCVSRSVPVAIISHKTRTPYLGPAFDLHQSARDWLEAQGVFGRLGLARESVHLELTKQDKLRRIAENRCTHFVDDLPEFLLEPSFPAGVERILFDPGGIYEPRQELRQAGSWKEIMSWLLG